MGFGLVKCLLEATTRSAVAEEVLRPEVFNALLVCIRSSGGDEKIDALRYVAMFLDQVSCQLKIKI